MTSQHEKVALTKEKSAQIGSAQFGCRTRERVHHRIEVERRTADDLEHVGGRGLLLQRLREIAGFCLPLFEQLRVLNGDGRLVGEGFEQLAAVPPPPTPLSPPDALRPPR